MRACNDPTADIAIAHVMRRKRKPYKAPKHGQVSRAREPKGNGGINIRINKSEWFYSRFRNVIEEEDMKTYRKAQIKEEGRDLPKV